MKPTSSPSGEVIQSISDGWDRLIGRYRNALMMLYLVAALFFLALGSYEWQRIGENTDAIMELCHQIGDVHDDIAASVLAVRDQERKGILLIVLASFIVTSALLHLMVSGARRHYLSLQHLASMQEGIIAERTREIKASNADLSREVAERRQREDELRIAGAVFESAAEAILVTDADNHIVRVNPAFTAISGYAASEVMGKDPALLKSGRHSAEFYAEMWEALRERGHWEGEIWNRHKAGDIYVAWLSISTIGDRRGAGPGAGQYLAIFHDITRRKADEELLRHRAHHDALTDLPNRSLFYDRLQATFNQAKRYHRIFALLQVDLDRFKEVNDTLGHTAGDELLVEAARRLSSCVREADTVARLGGDEFAIILSDMASEDEAEQVADRAVQLLAEPYHLDAGTAQISGCIGIALYPQHGQDSEQLLKNADSAMYVAKTGGRNAYRVYSPIQHSDKLQGELL